MKKILIAGIVLIITPFVSFAQTAATGTPVAPAPAAAPAETVAPGLVPGDFFYFLDNWGENLRLIFTFNKEAKAKLHLEYAKERVAEMKDVLNKHDAKLEDIKSAKENFDAQVADAATLVKSEKDNGADVADLARELSDELDQSRSDLKDILKEHQDNAGQAEQELRAKLASLAPTDPQVQGLTQALESITKEKGNAMKEEHDVDTNISDEEALFEEAMGPQMAAERHMEQAALLSAELQAAAGQGSSQAGVQLMKQAQEAMKRGDFEAAKRMSKDAEHRLENMRMIQGGMDPNMPGMNMQNASGTEVDAESGSDVGAEHLNNLEQGIKEGEKMMERVGR